MVKDRIASMLASRIEYRSAVAEKLFDEIADVITDALSSSTHAHILMDLDDTDIGADPEEIDERVLRRLCTERHDLVRAVRARANKKSSPLSKHRHLVAALSVLLRHPDARKVVVSKKKSDGKKIDTKIKVLESMGVVAERCGRRIVVALDEDRRKGALVRLVLRSAGRRPMKDMTEGREDRDVEIEKGVRDALMLLRKVSRILRKLPVETRRSLLAEMRREFGDLVTTGGPPETA